MSVLTNDNRFTEFQNQHNNSEVTTMCEVLDRAINKGKQEGLEQGKVKVLLGLVADNILDMQSAIVRSGLSEADFMKYAEELKKDE